MPPPGHGLHHYYFKLYALDTELAVEPGLDKDALLARISHSLGWWAAFYVPKGRESATDGFGVVRCTLKSG